MKMREEMNSPGQAVTELTPKCLREERQKPAGSPCQDCSGAGVWERKGERNWRTKSRTKPNKNCLKELIRRVI